MALHLVAATANPHKLTEMSAILGDRVELVARPADVSDVVEDAPTLLGNARLKAQAISSATGQPAIADDTGLEVDALDGAPGVITARYAGPGATDADNVARLLRELDGVAEAERTARFHTVIVAAWPDGHEVVGEGYVQGRIAAAARGEAGFGYDPVFVPDDAGGATFAEMTEAAKNAISHRRRALEDFVARLIKSSPEGGVASERAPGGN